MNGIDFRKKPTMLMINGMKRRNNLEKNVLILMKHGKIIGLTHNVKYVGITIYKEVFEWMNVQDSGYVRRFGNVIL
jgi:L-cystine uptake protein TcyP (sodium:dicarboxylate symporter family)